MSTRRIEASIAQNATTDLAERKFARFAVTSDTGAIANATIIAARLYISAFRSYSSSYLLHVKYDSSSGDTLAKTGELASNNTVHEETLALSSIQAGLMSATPENIYLVVDSTSGAGNKINFRELCTITIEIDYVTACKPPSGVKLSANTSEGDPVTLSWNAGSGGDGNAFSYYQIARKESTDGKTWGSLGVVTTSTMLACLVSPPATFGSYYSYYVRTMGEAGEAYASDWVQCSGTLYNPPTAKCTAPSGVTLSSTTTTHANVTLAWNAGAGGAHNAASYYQIARKESADGKTWGSLTTYKSNAGNVTSYSVPPPAEYGKYYLYYVRLVGAAGTSYASDWVQCSRTLQHVRPALVSYTDDTITAGTTRIKAAHITELQTNVNRLRNGLGLASYSFTSLRAGYTSLAGWSAHVQELRAAIDEMGTTHEAWLAIPANSPTAAVMLQLRRVVAAV